jgi:hypothetical protein
MKAFLNQFSNDQLILLLGFFTSLALLFSPIVEVYITGVVAADSDITIYGITLSGATALLHDMEWPKNMQFLAILVLCMNWLLALKFTGKSRLTVLTINAFLFSMLPVWVMLYVEGFMKSQVGPAIRYEYTFGILFAIVAMVCATFAILNEQQEERTNRLELQILDKGV